jgi:tRNA threonylcarbamoyl adenosine modification protein YeaZ
MKLLLIDSNPNSSFVAYYTDSEFITSKTADFMTADEQKSINKSPDKLIQCLDYIANQPGKELEYIDAVSVTIGPGSFTGIRVGLAIAKGIANSLEKKIIPVNNFHLMLSRLLEIDKNKTYCVLIPAKLPELYYSLIKNKKDIKSGIVQLTEINTIIDENTAVVSDFSDETVGNLSYFSPSGINKLNYEPDSMAKLSAELFESGYMFPSGEVKPLYIKDFVFRKTLSNK